MKVIIVDDEQAILKMYKLSLEAAGLEVLTAATGVEALEKIKQEKPQVVLLDIIMPQLNGLDVLTAIKEDETTKNIPVYLLTNLPEECSGDKAKELGAAGYFVKAQTEPQEIVQKVKNMASAH